MEYFGLSLLLFRGPQFVRKNIAHHNTIRIFSSAKSNYVDHARDVIANAEYNPSLYCRLDFHGQLQTSIQYCARNLTRLAKHFIFRHWAIYYKREKLVLPDRGTVALDWARCDGFDELPYDAPVVILFHGLVGDSQSEYIYHMTWHLMNAGYRVVVMIARGCGGLELTSCATFIGKKESDAHNCIKAVKIRYPNSKVFLLGFSLGAASTLNYLAEYDSISKSELTAAMCVSPPWNMKLQQGDRWLMNLWFMLLVLPVKAYILRHFGVLKRVQEKFGDDVSLMRILSVKDMAELDRVLFHTYNGTHDQPSTHTNAENCAAAEHLLVAAAQAQESPSTFEYPAYGTVEDYYHDVSPKNVAHHITTPTLAISASDDPICMVKHCPTDPESLGPGLVVVRTKYGGHLAFPDGFLPLTRAWTDKVAVEWFNKFL